MYRRDRNIMAWRACTRSVPLLTASQRSSEVITGTWGQPMGARQGPVWRGGAIPSDTKWLPMGSCEQPWD